MAFILEHNKITLSEEQKQLAKELKISLRFLRLLLARGFKNDEIKKYLYPTLNDMSSPFDISGMKEASERIKLAIKKKEKILIFGDYDCDGICAISILTLYLKDKLDVKYFIPDRNKHGYGMTLDVLEQLIKTKKPNLVITVDCGITSVEETEFLKTNGIDVLITDHHEPQDIIPNTIVVDPKIGKKGFYDFCGAGVALKLVEALAGREESKKYLDIAAIATIADVVPLVDENRIIAKFGLDMLEKSSRKGIKMLFGNDKITSQDIMFKIAPRINAAGRLNSAMKVVDLFLDSDYFLLRSLADDLEKDNSKRQEICENVVEDAKRALIGVDFNKTAIIILESGDWEAGVLGIAAARLTEEFKRPTVLFAKNGDELKGSTRSIKEVNIFDLLTKLSMYFTNFGGHAQAAGISMKIENFARFKDEANNILLSEHSMTDFLPKIVCESELDIQENVLEFSKELGLMEPTGYGNPKPNFVIKAENLKFENIGFTQHIKCVEKNIDLLGFSRFADAMSVANGKCEIEATLSINEFQNNVTAQAIIKSMQAVTVKISEEDAKLGCLHHLTKEGSVNVPIASKIDVEKWLEKPFGTLFVCFSQSDYENLLSKFNGVKLLALNVGISRTLNTENAIVCIPSESFNFSYYDQIILCGNPLSEGYIEYLKQNNKNVYALNQLKINKIEISDSAIRNVFRVLRELAFRRDKFQNFKKLYLEVKNKVNVSFVEFKIILEIFKELNLISVTDRGIINIQNKKTELQKSVIYRNLHIGK